jgi:MFS family permease
VLLETGTLISGIGNGVALVVLPWLVLERTGSASIAGLVSAAALIPLLVSSVVAGTIVDIIGRRRTSVGSDVLSGVAAAAIPVVDLLGNLTATWIVALAMLGAVFDPAGFTARETMLPEAATRAGWRLDRVNGIHEAIFGVSFIIGPGLGGLMIAWFGPLTALWVTAGGFVIAAILTACIRGLPGAGKPSRHDEMAGAWQGAMDGFVFVWRDPALRSVAVLSCAIVAAYLPFESVIFPVYFESQGEPERLGLIVTAMSAGGIVGALAHARVVDLVGRRTVFVWGIFVTCLLLGLTALFPPFWLMVVLSVGVGALYGPVNPIVNLAMQVLTPEQLRGRVTGVITSSAYAAGPIGLLLAGPLVEWRGVRTAALVFATLVILAAMAGFFLPGLRRLDNLDVVVRQPTPMASPSSPSGAVEPETDLLVGSVARHDLPAEGSQRDGNHLEVGDAERDPDDRDAERHAGHDVPDREPDAGDDDPDDVAQRRGDAG